MLRGVGSFTLAALYTLSADFWSTGAWGQQTRVEFNFPVQYQAEPKKRSKAHVTTQPSSPKLAPVTTEPSSPKLTPVALPASNPTSALGSALASCEDGSEGSGPLSLPGVKGEVKLDLCYRGRDHLVCSFNALLKEAKTLIGDYGKILEANYPDVSNINGVCVIKPSKLATDLENASDFTNRFKALKAEYEARTNCASRIEQSLRDVTLPDMAQAPEILQSMIDSIDGDIRGLSVVQAQVVELAAKIDSSQKAMVTIQKVHQTMCLKDQRAGMDEDRASR